MGVDCNTQYQLAVSLLHEGINKGHSHSHRACHTKFRCQQFHFTVRSVKATALMCDLHDLVVGEHLNRTEVSLLSTKKT